MNNPKHIEGMNKNDSEKVVSYLTQYKKKLETHFPWDPTKGNMLNSLGQILNFDIDISEVSNVDKNLVIRDFISKNWPTDLRIQRELSKWIIHDWGGIRAFKNFEHAAYFLNNPKSILSSPKFHNRVSSLSKIVAFRWPEKYAILDAKVSIILNWVLYLKADYRGPFLIDMHTKTRSKAMKNIPFSDSYKKINVSGPVFLKPTNNYTGYCERLRDLSIKLFPDDNYGLQKTEMLLFTLADLTNEGLYTEIQLFIKNAKEPDENTSFQSRF